jgi:predicted ATP-binding protein involved in virulence
MLAMLDGFEDIHIDRKPLAMKVKKDGRYLKLNQLSDGEKCTIALFGDLARRMAIANPQRKNPLEGTGVVLIDELDLHMHTSWQRKVMNVLKRTFPNIQFIITTHSPQILGELDEDFLYFTR